MAKQAPLHSLLPFLLLALVLASQTFASIYDDFHKCFIYNSSIVLSQKDTSFLSVLQAYIRNKRFNTSSTPKPNFIVIPKNESHVQSAILCSKSLSIQLKIRSGGHDFEGISYISSQPFFILDMSNFKAINVNIEEETATVESGALLGELYYRIWEKSKVHGFPAGVCSTVGVGGHFSGGGYGNLLRKHGLSVDHVIDAKIVDVNGKVLGRESMGEDLFWAIRGGGGASFGVVLSYKIKLVRVPEIVTVFRVERLLNENATEVVYKWQEVAPKTDENLFMRLLLQPVTNNKRKTIRASVLAEFLGDSNRLVSLLNKDFPELRLKEEDCREMSWINSVLWWGNFENGTSPGKLLNRTSEINFLKRKSDYVQNPISKVDLERLWKNMTAIGKPGLVFNPYGGRMNNISASETPFPHRAGNLYKIQYSVNWEEAGKEAENKYINDIRRLYRFMTPFVSKNPRRSYINYRDLDIGVARKWTCDEGKAYGVKYFKDNYKRLVKVKNEVDPDNFFRNEQSIPPCKE